MKEVNINFVKNLYKKRDPWCHKGDFGKLLIVGGNKKYSGSPALNALAAYRTGADLVIVAAPRRAADIIAAFSPNMITYPLEGDFLALKHLKTILSLADDSDAVVIGGGLGKEKQTITSIQTFLSKLKKPCVIDADAIHAVAKNKNIIKKNFVLTPQVIEFLALTGKDVRKISLEERERAVEESALKLKTTIVLKGHVDVISGERGTTINTSGSEFMTKGGTGDTLAGICGALLARGINPQDAAAAATFINGAAGSLAAKKFGESLLATDLIDFIHEVLLTK